MLIVITFGILNDFDMKKCPYFMLLLVITLMACTNVTSQKVRSNLDHIQTQREFLKEYFLCMCIIEGFKDIKISEYDISPAVYFDILSYDPKAFQEVSNYAKKFIASIEPSVVEDLGNKKAIIILSIEKYKSEEVNKFIKSMDKYVLDE
jgi:hypothetical protein